MQPEPSKLSSNNVNDITTDTFLHPAHHGILQDGVPPSHGQQNHQGDTSRSSDGVFGHESRQQRPGATDNETLNLTTSNDTTRQSNSDTFVAWAEDTEATQNGVDTRFVSDCNLQSLPNELLIHALSHLNPSDMMSVALVNKQFYSLVTSPDAWRAAFARFFPGPAIIRQTADGPINDYNISTAETFRSDRRRFCRITNASIWREEYISRAHLLRSLERGRPTQYMVINNNGPTGQIVQGTPTTMFMTPSVGHITSLSCNFDASNGNQAVSLLHGCNITSEAVLSSTAVDEQLHPRWSTFNEFEVLRRFNQVHAGEVMWGLGTGEVVGCPNVMDLSRLYGTIFGEGLPNGRLFFRFMKEKTSHSLIRPDLTTALNSLPPADRPVGVPIVTTAIESITSVWVAKSDAIPSLSNGMVGMFSGSSHGILSAHSLGHLGMRDEYLNRAELTARWVLSPGVPIIAIAVDDQYSLQRQAQNRIWAVVLNALGEIFYISQMPQRTSNGQHRAADGSMRQLVAEKLAWEAGRTVHWELIEGTRRVATPDPYKDRDFDGSYTPRSSWRGMCLTDVQIAAETAEIQTYLDKTPKEFRLMCEGWDMQRKLEVDFAGDDGNLAGEVVVVMSCALQEDIQPQIHRFTRCKVKHAKSNTKVAAESATANSRSGSSSPERRPTEEWKTATLSVGSGSHVFGITASGIDCSKLATITLSEDPLISSSDDIKAVQTFIDSSEYLIPGQRARFLAIGTNTGVIYLWDMRAASNSDRIELDPLRIIYTPSPEITSVSLTALYLVHGGSDSLVQLWDPLASTVEPIRTINGRVSTRMRRRYDQLAARFPVEWGIDMIGAHAISLDPDPQRLRGVVAIGVQLKSWSFRSSNLFGISGKSGRRKLRKAISSSRRGSAPVSGQRTELLDSIEDELEEIKNEKKQAAKQKKRMESRFGVGMLAEDEEMQLAVMLSTEAFAVEEERKSSESEKSGSTPTAEASRSNSNAVEFSDADVAEAIRRSLVHSAPGTPISSQQLDSPVTPESASWNVPIRFSARKGSWKRPSTAGSESGASPKLYAEASSSTQEQEDLEMALRMSMVEQGAVRSLPRRQSDGMESVTEEDEFPALSEGGNGKGKSGRKS